MDSEFYADLSQDLLLMLNDADDYNVIIQTGGGQNIKDFRAHSNILRARSPYFKSALSENWITKKNNMIEFKKPNIRPTVFEIILKYVTFLILKNLYSYNATNIFFFFFN
jgi:hypothetical protein